MTSDRSAVQETSLYQQRAHNADPRWILSPEDHAILEAEYQLNPKPDKAARMQIVERVALGEKEVQVSYFGQITWQHKAIAPLLSHNHQQWTREIAASGTDIGPSRSGSRTGVRTRDANRDPSSHRT